MSGHESERERLLSSAEKGSRVPIILPIICMYIEIFLNLRIHLDDPVSSVAALMHCVEVKTGDDWNKR